MLGGEPTCATDHSANQARAVGFNLRRSRQEGVGRRWRVRRPRRCQRPVTAPSERGHSVEISVGGEIALRIDYGVQPHPDTRVEVRPLPIRVEPLDAERQPSAMSATTRTRVRGMTARHDSGSSE